MIRVLRVHVTRQIFPGLHRLARLLLACHLRFLPTTELCIELTGSCWTRVRAVLCLGPVIDITYRGRIGCHQFRLVTALVRHRFLVGALKLKFLKRFTTRGIILIHSKGGS